MSEVFKLREGIEFNIAEEARYGFEFFTFRSPPMQREMDRFLEMTKGCFRFLDVGSFHGVFSLAFCCARELREAHCIEPSPVAWPILCQNINLNPILFISAEQTGFSNYCGTADMGFEWDHAVVKPAVESQIIKAEMMTGDRYCQETGFKPDVVKIDVEGHELKVLLGMEHVLKECRPLIFLELHPDHLEREGDSIPKVYELIESLNYSIDDKEDQLHVILTPR